jgi:hypothetical protein
MKRFITAMLFSLTVIVCEQQTLFAPHFRDGLTAATPSDTTNSLIPIAGVNRSGVARSKTAEVANNLSGPRSLVPVAGYTDKLSYDDMSGEWFSGPADRGKTDDYVGDQDPGAGMWIDCPPYEPCDDPAFHDHGAFLPWHRGSIYQ